jgi:hypothetical protein
MKCSAEQRLWQRVSKQRTPEEWVSRIDLINPASLRVKVACIVWWDYFGGRETERAWHQLDHYVRAWNPNLPEDVSLIVKELIQLGYPVEAANRRMRKRSDIERVMRRGITKYAESVQQQRKDT